MRTLFLTIGTLVALVLSLTATAIVTPPTPADQTVQLCTDHRIIPNTDTTVCIDATGNVVPR